MCRLRGSVAELRADLGDLVLLTFVQFYLIHILLSFLLIVFVEIMCMQQVMRFLAHRMTEELLVQLDDVGILVRLADLLAGILAVGDLRIFLPASSR